MRYTDTPSGPRPDALNPAVGRAAEDRSAGHEDDATSVRAGSRLRRCRATPRRPGVLAVTAGAVLLVAACGGGPAGTGSASGTGGSPGPASSSAGSGGSTNTAGSTQAQQYLAFAQCMRAEGMTGFPDPGSDGHFGPAAAQMEDRPHFVTDYNACQHLLPEGGESKAAEIAPQLLKFAECMHAHGVPSWPEPGNPNGGPKYGDLSSNGSVDLLKEAGVNPNSPVVQAALQVCERGGPEAG